MSVFSRARGIARGESAPEVLVRLRKSSPRVFSSLHTERNPKTLTIPIDRRQVAAIPNKPLPHNDEAEKAVLGAIMLEESVPNARLKEIAAKLMVSDFFVYQHRIIFKHMLAMRDQRIDTITLGDAIRAAGELEAAGGPGYLSHLLDGVPHVTNYMAYTKIVRQQSNKRSIAVRAYNLGLRAEEENANLQEITNDVEQLVKDSAELAADRKRGLIASQTDTFALMELPPVEYIIEPLLTMRGRGMIYSPRGAGKTFVTLQIAYAIATGLANCFVWYIPKSRRVVYVDGEMHAAMLQDRLRLIVRINGIDPPNNLLIITRDLQQDVQPTINTPIGRAQIEEHLEAGTVLILDNISSLSPSSDERETEDWAEIEKWVSHLSFKGISTIFVHHSGKSGDQRGSSKREDLLDFVLKLGIPSDYRMDEGLRAELFLTKKRGKIAKPAWGWPFEVRLGIDERGEPAWTMRALRELLKERARLMLADGMKPNDVAQETGLDRWTIARLKKKVSAPDPDLD